MMRVAALLLALAGPRALAAAGDLDLWYVVEVAGARSGFMHVSRTTDGDRITSHTRLRIEVKRGTTSIPLELEARFVETSRGAPIAMRSIQSLGAPPTTTDHVFGAAAITVTITSAPGGARVTTAPLPAGDWLAPAAAARYVRGRLAAGAREIVVRTIDVLVGPDPVVTTRRVLEETAIDVLGTPRRAIRCASTISVTPGERVEYLDAGGTLLRSTVDLGGIPLTLLLADENRAREPVDPPDLMRRTSIEPDRPIAGERGLRRATYVLSVADGSLPDVPASAVQRVERLDDRSARVSIDLTAPAPAATADATDPRFTDSSPMITAADPLVRALAERALGALPAAERADPARRAEALRRLVVDHIDEKSLGVGFATAADTARSRRGDCTEHAVLLAALLRAAAIPARIVSGLVYVDGFGGPRKAFGYHMWAQALVPVGGRLVWADLDAALSRTHPTDATHIALAFPDLDSPTPQAGLLALAPILGRLRIEVERTG